MKILVAGWVGNIEKEKLKMNHTEQTSPETRLTGLLDLDEKGLALAKASF